MTSRERIKAALQHKEPDRVPVDLGGMDATGITGPAYWKLKKYLNLSYGDIKLITPMGQEVILDDEVLQIIGADVKMLAREPNEWKSGTMSNGNPCLIPALWKDRLERDGSRVILDDEGRIVSKMPAGGYYFDRVYFPLASCSSIEELEKYQKYFDTSDWLPYINEDDADLAQRGKYLYENTDYALFGLFGAHVFAMGQSLRGWGQFLVDLIENPSLAEAIMDRIVDVAIERFDNFIKAVGKYVLMLNVNDDLGTQTAPFLSLELYQKHVKPYHKKLYRYIKDNSDVYLFLHTDGAVAEFIPDLIDCGVDILNPVQFTARNMDVTKLKKEYGKDLTFWGGGCDTQYTLPLGTPLDVKAEVKRQLDVLAPGGGYVFSQIHNIQEEVPPENVLAMYEAIREWE